MILRGCIAASLSVLVLSGCSSFKHCHKLVDTVEKTTDPVVYDHWQAEVVYEQNMGSYVWNCKVFITASGYIGQKADLTTRPDYIDEVLK